jgi:signal transduction histidine kinase
LPLLRAKAGQINMLASEMVEAARLEDRRLQLKLRPVDLAEVITQNIEQVRQTAEAKHHITLDAPMASPVWVLGDAMRLDIIVANLLDNAVKYSPAGGEIKCELAVAEGLALFTVRDHGIGISLEDMPRLFIRFSRLASARLSDVPGTGLGLYLGRELARLHGGDILAISKLDEGSEFTLSIPLKLDEG